MRKKLTIAAIITTLAVATTACSTVNTQPDQQALRYSDPAMGAKQYKEHFGPSSYDMASMMNVDYTYPAGQRVYSFLPGDGGDGNVFAPTTKDGVTLTVEGSVRFALTSEPEKLQEFHEKIGLRMKAYDDEGWREMLRVYLRASINRAITDATQGLNWADIYTDPAVKAEWEKDVADLLPQYVEQAIGGDYIGDFEVTLQKPILPEDLENALKDAEVAAQQARVQEERNQQVNSELDSIRELVDVLGPDGYNVYQAIKDGKVTVMPIPTGSDITIPTK